MREALKDILVEMLNVGDTQLKLTTKPTMVLVIGVNGVGKTTTIGKLANQLKNDGKKVLLCAADTFRAAAADQLEIWAGRAGVDIIRQHEGADPAAVVFDAISAAKARHSDVILCDTAGRLHNKQNLMNELGKISRIIDRELPNADKEVLLVIDGTTGQNGLIAGKAVPGDRRSHRHGPDQAGRHRKGRHCHCGGGFPANSGEVYWRGRGHGGSDAL